MDKGRKAMNDNMFFCLELETNNMLSVMADLVKMFSGLQRVQPLLCLDASVAFW